MSLLCLFGFCGAAMQIQWGWPILNSMARKMICAWNYQKVSVVTIFQGYCNRDSISSTVSLPEPLYRLLGLPPITSSNLLFSPMKFFKIWEPVLNCELWTQTLEYELIVHVLGLKFSGAVLNHGWAILDLSQTQIEKKYMSFKMYTYVTKLVIF